jgi:hypothetical protein
MTPITAQKIIALHFITTAPFLRFLPLLCIFSPATGRAAALEGCKTSNFFGGNLAGVA